MLEDMSRRNFIKTSAAIGAGIYVRGKALGADTPQKDVINVALLGAGAQGQVLMSAILKKKDPSIRFVAVCDIWEKVNLEECPVRCRRTAKN
ncbi:MAG: twin-arginine translocation signal domain-containing protein, partial [Anaerohalosphaeraceae bacterium]